MQKPAFLAACLFAVVATGCAGPEASDEPVHSRPETTTGSNIPRKARAAEAPPTPSAIPQGSAATG